ncbi:hypothetical protein SAMN05421753_10466 [Planctomicrobium piriforme]|uniref:Uncharacterized protein n=1 Tax=Planctomicrobium piriforme TaxID=1576369 RepID=A0A1I3E4D9_9PLAN|nr:hypothetical protein SAMN05421753_10466 [Planctomicrobium piriforme]
MIRVPVVEAGPSHPLALVGAIRSATDPGTPEKSPNSLIPKFA